MPKKFASMQKLLQYLIESSLSLFRMDLTIIPKAGNGYLCDKTDICSDFLIAVSSRLNFSPCLASEIEWIVGQIKGEQ